MKKSTEVYKTRAAAEKRVSSRVGDYVEFEEVETESEEEQNWIMELLNMNTNMYL